MRIITGIARGLRLKVPRGMGTRPTADRIKESIFNILNGQIGFEGLAVLDLFAGTGALGLEAMSRGAAVGVFIDTETAGIIEDNARRARLKAEVIRGDAVRQIGRLSRQGREFDIIFCDPPYGKGLWQEALKEVDKCGILSESGLMVIEQDIKEAGGIELNGLEMTRRKEYGRTTAVEIYQKKCKRK